MTTENHYWFGRNLKRCRNWITRTDSPIVETPNQKGLKGEIGYCGRRLAVVVEYGVRRCAESLGGSRGGFGSALHVQRVRTENTLSRFGLRAGVERMEVRAIAIYRAGGCERRASPAEERRPSHSLQSDRMFDLRLAGTGWLDRWDLPA
jgi:hypothetical protein